LQNLSGGNQPEAATFWEFTKRGSIFTLSADNEYSPERLR
jgi:hypothetical protein